MGTGPASALERLQLALGYRWSDLQLLQRALTHRSFSAHHNERLEFLGDAVLSAGISSLLYQRFGDGDEGHLTRVRATLVREDSLYRKALELGIPEVLRVSEGEAKGGGLQRPSLLADALEALIGAVFLESGYPAAAAVVERLWGGSLDVPALGLSNKDPKTALQEWLQGRRLPVPAYRITATHGQAHAQSFDVECAVSALAQTTVGHGRSRRVAEQEAARQMLQRLQEESS